MAEQLFLALKQCISPMHATVAKAIHSNFLKLGNLSVLHLRTRQLKAYFKCGYIDDACRLFDEMDVLCKQPPSSSLIDVVCWNSVISGCVQNGRDEKAFQYFENMQQYYYHTHYSDSNCYDLDELSPDSYTISSLLSSTYCLERNIILGKLLQGYAVKTGIFSSLSVGNALITLYARWNRLQESRLVFDCMAMLNVVSWTALISGYAQQRGYEEESSRLFVDMLRNKDQRPNQFTFASIFSSCGRLASLSQGIPLTTVGLKMGLLFKIEVQNSLIGFYSACGCLEEAKATFKSITNPDLISWNSLLKGYSQQGNSEEALNVFEEMCTGGEKPDAITMLSVLSACRHTGMVSQGLHLFRSMKQDHGIDPQAEHISCIVDLLGRAGQLHQAEKFIRGFQYEQLGPSIWRTLLGACQVHGQAELAEFAASRLLELEPYDTEAHIVLSHIYAASGRWDMAANLRCSMKEKGLGKEPGCSWIEIRNKVHSFVAKDWGHPQIAEIQTALIDLTHQIKECAMEVLLD